MVTDPGGVEALNPHFSMILEYGGVPVFQGYGYRSIERYLNDVVDVIHCRIMPAELELTRPSIQQALVSTAVVEAANLSLMKGGEWSAVDDTT